MPATRTGDAPLSADDFDRVPGGEVVGVAF
jgi:hypothetical protein